MGLSLGLGWGLGLGLGRLVGWPWASEAKMRRSGRSQQRDDLMIQVTPLWGGIQELISLLGLSNERTCLCS